jgi:hypothetical protein
MNRLLGLIVVATLAGCYESRSQVADYSRREYETATQEVGRRYWITDSIVGVSVCDSPDLRTQSCSFHKSGSFVVTGIVAAGSRNYYALRFDDGASGYHEVMPFSLRQSTSFSAIDPAVAAAECRRRGSPRIGMTVDQVFATCWGRPTSVNRTETAGIVSDQFVYSGRDAYVYVANGVVTAIQSSGRLR